MNSEKEYDDDRIELGDKKCVADHEIRGASFCDPLRRLTSTVFDSVATTRESIRGIAKAVAHRT